MVIHYTSRRSVDDHGCGDMVYLVRQGPPGPDTTPASQLERELPGLNNLMEDAGIQNSLDRGWQTDVAINHAFAWDSVNKGVYDYA